MRGLSAQPFTVLFAYLAVITAGSLAVLRHRVGASRAGWRLRQPTPGEIDPTRLIRLTVPA
jgi:hypothetical protein